MNDNRAGASPVERSVRPDAYRCISPVCVPLGCSGCNCAVPADVYAALGAAFQAKERERYAPLMQAVEWLLADGHMNQEHLARLRAAFEAA